MATWNGKPKQFNIEYYHDYGSDYGTGEINWKYGTTSDYLTITYKDPKGKVIEESYPQDRALAHLECMMDWMATYEGIESLEELFNKVKDSKK